MQKISFFSFFALALLTTSLSRAAEEKASSVQNFIPEDNNKFVFRHSGQKEERDVYLRYVDAGASEGRQKYTLYIAEGKRKPVFYEKTIEHDGNGTPQEVYRPFVSEKHQKHQKRKPQPQKPQNHNDQE
jgi:hypothetical protein